MQESGPQPTSNNFGTTIPLPKEGRNSISPLFEVNTKDKGTTLPDLAGRSRSAMHKGGGPVGTRGRSGRVDERGKDDEQSCSDLHAGRGWFSGYPSTFERSSNPPSESWWSVEQKTR